MKQWQCSSIRILGLAATAFFVTSAMADVKIDTTGRTFEKVELTEPLNWLAGKSLFPGRVIAGYNANLDEYSAESWVQHVLEQGKAHKACTSVLAFQATNSGDSPKERYWFGYAFRGPPTTEKNYDRDDDVSDSIAYTAVLESGAEETDD